MSESKVNRKKVAIAVLVAVIIGTWGYALATASKIGVGAAPTSSTTPRANPAPEPNPVVQLGEWSWSSGHGWATAEGQVTNPGGAPLKHVQAVVTWFDQDGGFITSETGLVEFDPLLPGQTSPWKAMARHNPRMAKAKVEFKRMLGGPLEVKKASQ